MIVIGGMTKSNQPVDSAEVTSMERQHPAPACMKNVASLPQKMYSAFGGPIGPGTINRVSSSNPLKIFAGSAPVVCGGLAKPGGNTETTLDQCYVLDFVSNRWREGAKLPSRTRIIFSTIIDYRFAAYKVIIFSLKVF